MTDITVGLFGVAVLMVGFLSGLELSVCMILVGGAGFAYIKGLDAAFSVIASDFYDVFVSYSFSVVPLFILMGQLAFSGGIAKQIYNTAYRFGGHVPGGLAIATVLGATLFKAVCGSAAATTATFTSVAIPEMDRFGYSRKLSTGIVATVGTLGMLIPPSVALIVFGIIGQQPIGKLFMGGLIPGLMLALLFMGVIFVWCRVNPSIGPRGKKYSWKERIAGLPEVGWPLAIFVVVVGGMLGGFFTPTQAGAVGAFTVLGFLLAMRHIKYRGVMDAVTESLRASCMILTLLLGSTVLGHFIALTGIPAITADWVSGLPVSRWVVMIIICLVYLVGGSIIDDVAFVILATPIFFPSVERLGFDPIWFLITIAITVAMGAVVPPVAMNVFIVKNMTKEPLSLIYSGVGPFLVGLVVCLILIFVFPQLVTWVPNTFVK